MAEKAEVAPQKSKTKLLLFIVLGLLVLLLVIGGVVAFLLLKSPSSAAEGDAAVAESSSHSSSKASSKSKDKKATPPVFEKLQQFTVNLASPDGDTLLQTEIALELAGEHDKEVLKQYEPKVRNEILKLLRTKTPADVNAPDAQDKLAKEIREAVNKAMGTTGEDEGVRSVNFTSFIVGTR